MSKQRVVVSILALLAACQPRPEPIRFGEDVCVYCQMGISDPRFGAELLTQQGRAYKFDALECMVEFERSGQVPTERIHSRWVVDFGQPGELIALESAEFVFTPAVHSPMGLNVYAVLRGRYEADSLLPRGRKISWQEVVELVQTQWRQGPLQGSPLQ
ncbi:MAG: hypothetical protein ABDH31_05650 [Chlorobiota bacterium]